MPAPSPQQLAASDPARSVWVAANAGSGKTTVLVSRVIRLLLAGADPARILCVTYTKAAAANMQDKIFSRLGGWVALPDAALLAEVAELTGGQSDQGQLTFARQLFARAVETPGGLKIQTIHSFCERLLHLFPFESAVPARFEMLDETAAALAMDRAISGMMRAALADPAGALGAAQRVAADTAGEDSTREALKTFIGHRRNMKRRPPERKFAVSPLRIALDVPAGETAEGMTRRFFTSGLPTRNIGEVCDWLAGGSKTDRERADDMKAARGLQGGEDLDLYLLVFLTKDGEPRKKLATDKLVKARPDLHDALVEEQERVHALQDRLKAAAAAERTEAIILLADEVLARYEAEKRRLGRLDFHDLIARAKALLTSDASRWVLFKLDQGVDHILVDEAQDTSPDQWAVIKALSDEFFAGAGARGSLQRTIFAVGDEKQSIFGFQGAKPEEFDKARRHYQTRIAAHNAGAEREHGFDDIKLRISYRTTDDILSAVDQVFGVPEHHAGLSSDASPTVHETSRINVPGLVELWPPEEPPAAQEKDPDAPVDEQAEDSAPARLADRIARRIRWWMPPTARPSRPATSSCSCGPVAPSSTASSRR
jgi:ATP-dependent helicase/nuclease subunit A